MIKIDAARLPAAVIQSGMGEVELCTKARVGHQTFAKMIKGQMVQFLSVGRICAVPNVSPAEIIKEVPDEIVPSQGQQELVSQAERHVDKSEDIAQGPRFAAVGRIPV